MPTATTVNHAYAGSAAKVLQVAMASDPTLCTKEFRNLKADNLRRAEDGSGKGSIHFLMQEQDLVAAITAESRKKHYRYSKMPGFARLCHKVPFAEMMAGDEGGGGANPAAAGADADADAASRGPTWWPKTWVVPDDAVPPSAFRKGALIFKPDDSAQGDGITICMTAADLQRQVDKLSTQSSGSKGVVQRYVQNAMLLGGHKFDLRLYVLVLGAVEPKAFLLREGLVRVCPTAYSKPTKANAHKTNVHLTNYSLAKYDRGFEHADDPADGSAGTKRALSAVLPVLQAEGGHDPDAIWEGLRECCGGIASRMAATVAAAAAAAEGGGGSGKSAARKYKDDELLKAFATERREPDIDVAGLQEVSFHILGVDVLLDAAGSPHVLEVNNNPSFCIDSVFPVEGPHVTPHPPSNPARDALIAPALQYVKKSTAVRKGIMSPCKCKSHHRPHEHYPCAVDLAAKRAAVGGAIAIVERDRRAQRAGGANWRPSAATLAAGTQYDPLIG